MIICFVQCFREVLQAGASSHRFANDGHRRHSFNNHDMSSSCLQRLPAMVEWSFSRLGSVHSPRSSQFSWPPPPAQASLKWRKERHGPQYNSSHTKLEPDSVHGTQYGGLAENREPNTHRWNRIPPEERSATKWATENSDAVTGYNSCVICEQMGNRILLGSHASILQRSGTAYSSCVTEYAVAKLRAFLLFTESFLFNACVKQLPKLRESLQPWEALLVNVQYQWETALLYEYGKLFFFTRFNLSSWNREMYNTVRVGVTFHSQSLQISSKLRVMKKDVILQIIARKSFHPNTRNSPQVNTPSEFKELTFSGGSSAEELSCYNGNSSNGVLLSRLVVWLVAWQIWARSTVELQFAPVRLVVAKHRDTAVAGWSTGLWVRREKIKMTVYFGVDTCSCSSRIEETLNVNVEPCWPRLKNQDESTQHEGQDESTQHEGQDELTWDETRVESDLAKGLGELVPIEYRGKLVQTEGRARLPRTKTESNRFGSKN
ncbi:hypothetical protein V8G54_006979 [Vigna mungo]|uniref:Uncharacterized protein n=1 Tax=Vigna mungo TaxID=3915 RepID=A0AAQ3P376_VIGMU